MFILFLYRSSSSSRFFRFRAILPIWVTMSWTDIFPKNCHFFCNFDSCFQPLFALVRLFQLFLQVNHMSRSFFFFFRLTWTFFCGCRISGRGEFSLLKKMKSCHKRIWIRQSSSSDSIRAVNWTLSSDTETNATTPWEQVQNLWRAQWKLVTTDVFYGCPPRYSCPNLVVPYTEKLISRPFLDENRFRLVSQDRISAQNVIGYMVFVSWSLFVYT